MRKIIHLVHQSLDGFIEGPYGEFDWPGMGPELTEYVQELHDQVDTFLYGRVVWDMMAGYWPFAESMSDDAQDRRFAPIWRAMSKVVVSTTVQHADWNTRVINESVVAQIIALKEQPGADILLIGGANLAAGLSAEGLLDERRIIVHPVVLGGGRPLFSGQRSRSNLKLVQSRVFDSRAVLLHYRC